VRAEVLTETPLKLTVSTLGFIVAGMVLGNMILVYMGLLPVVYILLSLLLDEPRSVEVVNPDRYANVWVDDVVELRRTVRVEGGLGHVTVGEALPPFFEVVEGSNFRVIWKGPGDLEEGHSYKIRCTKRGVYHLEDCDWEVNHPQGLKSAGLGRSRVEQTLIVKPHPFNIKRIRQQKVLSKMTMPSEAQIQMGIPTTEFREIREYAFGDSYRHINWKATARRAVPNKPPKVNDYEMEGMKVVWVFLNTASRMALGTNIRSGFEYAIQAVLGLSSFYLSRSCRVGVSFYSDEGFATPGVDGSVRMSTERLGDILVMPDIASVGPGRDAVEGLEPVVESTEDFLIPDMGKRQLYAINERLLRVGVLESRFDLQQCIRKCRGHIVGSNPLFIVVTMIDERRLGSLLEGLREMQKYIRRSRTGRPSVLIIHVSGFGVAAREENEEVASRLLEMEEKSILRTLRGYGAMVVHWNPNKQNFAEVLLSQVARR
jgi:uncharacterized protein (DUF58 family)